MRMQPKILAFMSLSRFRVDQIRHGYVLWRTIVNCPAWYSESMGHSLSWPKSPCLFGFACPGIQQVSLGPKFCPGFAFHHLWCHQTYSWNANAGSAEVDIGSAGPAVTLGVFFLNSRTLGANAPFQLWLFSMGFMCFPGESTESLLHWSYFSQLGIALCSISLLPIPLCNM